MRKPLLVLASLALSTLSLVAGDLTITSRVTGKGPGAKDGTQVQYISPDRMRLDQTGTQTDTLIDFGKGVMYVINHGKKTITRLTFQELQASMEAMNDRMGALSGMMSKMLLGDASKVSVQKEGTDTVLGRPCQKVRITIGKIVEDLSIDPTLQFPIRDYAKSMSMMSRVPGPMGNVFKRLYEEIGKLHGVALRTHVKGIMGSDLTTEATAISTAAIPASAWALPSGYQVVEGGRELSEGTHPRH